MTPSVERFKEIIEENTKKQKKAKAIDRAKKSQKQCRIWKEASMWGKRCIDCKIADPYVLDYYPKDDRFPKQTGRRTVNQYKNSGHINAMMDEIKEHSVIRCLNCQVRHLAEIGVNEEIEKRKLIIAEIQRAQERSRKRPLRIVKRSFTQAE